MNKSEESHDGKTPCNWCGREFDSADLIQGKVCESCYRLLVMAGISEREIFFGQGARRISGKKIIDTT